MVKKGLKSNWLYWVLGIVFILIIGGVLIFVYFNKDIIGLSPSAGLVAYYALNGNFSDGSGVGNNLGCSPSCPTLTGDGRINTAYYFNGVNSRLLASNLILPTNQYTASAWVKTERNSDREAIIEFTKSTQDDPKSKVTKNTRRGIAIAGDVNPGQPVIYYGNGKGRIANTPDLRDNQWHHVVGSYDGTNAHVYVDGKEVPLGAEGDAGLGGYVKAVSIGNNLLSNNYNHYFKGTIDEVKLYNRALSLGEVLELYNEGVFTCTDSDGGTDRFTKGLTQIKNGNGLVVDSAADICLGGENNVLEHYCVQGSDHINELPIPCSIYGCSDGACLQQPPPQNISYVDGCSYLNQETKDKISLIKSQGQTVILKELEEGYRNQYFVFPSFNYSSVMKLSSVVNQSGTSYSSDKVVFTDALTGITYEAGIYSKGKGTISFGGYDYSITYSGPSSNQDEIKVTVDYFQTPSQLNQLLTFYCNESTTQEQVYLNTESTKLFVGDRLNKAKVTITNSHLPTLLAQSKLIKPNGELLRPANGSFFKDYTLSQLIFVSNSSILDQNNPYIFITTNPDSRVYFYYFDFLPTLNFSSYNIGSDVKEVKINLLGENFIFQNNSNRDNIILYSVDTGNYLNIQNGSYLLLNGNALVGTKSIILSNPAGYVYAIDMRFAAEDTDHWKLYTGQTYENPVFNNLGLNFESYDNVNGAKIKFVKLS